MPNSAVVTRRMLRADVSFVRTTTARCPVAGYHRAGPNLLRGTHALHPDGAAGVRGPVEDWSHRRLPPRRGSKTT